MLTFQRPEGEVPAQAIRAAEPTVPGPTKSAALAATAVKETEAELSVQPAITPVEAVEGQAVSTAVDSQAAVSPVAAKTLGLLQAEERHPESMALPVEPEETVPRILLLPVRAAAQVRLETA